MGRVVRVHDDLYRDIKDVISEYERRGLEINWTQATKIYRDRKRGVEDPFRII